MKIFLMTLVVSQNMSQTTVSYYLLIRMAVIKDMDNTCVKVCEKTRTLIHR